MELIGSFLTLFNAIPVELARTLFPIWHSREHLVEHHFKLDTFAFPSWFWVTKQHPLKGAVVGTVS